MSDRHADFAAFLAQYGLAVTRDGENLVVGNEQRICDFCGSTPPVASFTATAQRVHDLTEDELSSQTVGDWLACDPCRTLIVARDRRGLLDRALAVLAPAFPDMPPAVVRAQVTSSHDAFWRGHREAN